MTKLSIGIGEEQTEKEISPVPKTFVFKAVSCLYLEVLLMETLG